MQRDVLVLVGTQPVDGVESSFGGPFCRSPRGRLLGRRSSLRGCSTRGGSVGGGRSGSLASERDRVPNLVVGLGDCLGREADDDAGGVASTVSSSPETWERAGEGRTDVLGRYCKRRKST